jgi:nucleotide-binding universal stress UspA family protein
VLLAERSGASLSILHVLDLTSSSEALALARTTIERLLNATGADAAERATVLVQRGDPAREVCRYAAGCDLVLMGKYGERNRPPIGSVTARVMHAAPCLVVPVWSPTGAGATTGDLETPASG